MIVIINKKGFTLVELLAVIVIIGILTLLAIPAVTKYINISRQRLFAENAIRAIEAVKDYELKEDYYSGSKDALENVECAKNQCNYNLDQINQLLDKKLNESPFGGEYNQELSSITSGKMLVKGKEHQAYKMCLIDDSENGFEYLYLDDINYKAVKIGIVTSCGDGTIGRRADEIGYIHKDLPSIENVQQMIDYLASLIK